MEKQQYLKKLELNLKLWPIRTAIESLLFFVPIWFAFETQFTSPGQLNVIYAMTMGLSIILDLPTGAMADVLGRKFSSIFGTILQGLSWIYISQARDASWLWVGYFVNAVGNANVSGADEALIYDSLKELGREKEFTRLTSRNQLIFRVGMIVSTLLGGIMYNYYRPLPYILVGVCSLIASVCTLFFTEPHRDTVKYSFKSYLKHIRQGARQLFKTQKQTLFSIYYILIGGVTFYYGYYLYLAFATHLGFTTDEISRLYPILYILNGGLMYFLAKIRDKVGKKRIIIAYPIIAIVGFVPGFWIGKTAGILCLFLVQMANMARYTFLNHYAHEEYESKYRATALSTLNLLTNTVFVIISLSASRLFDLYGAGFIMTALGAIVIATVIPLAIMFLRLGRNPTRVPQPIISQL